MDRRRQFQHQHNEDDEDEDYVDDDDHDDENDNDDDDADDADDDDNDDDDEDDDNVDGYNDDDNNDGVVVVYDDEDDDDDDESVDDYDYVDAGTNSMRSGGEKADPVPALSAVQLETRPMSRGLALGGGQRNRIISPTSAEVMARRDTGLHRSQLNRLSSRRTLQFKSPAEVTPAQNRREEEEERGSAQTVIRVNRSAVRCRA